jgi:cytochrome c oxidase subunit 3/cytochrome aa3-600 menaquinol oxidase subunit 3
MNEYETALFKDKQMGFFIYLGVEAVMFATLFATYMIFTPAVKGPHPSEVFEWKSMLLSSFFLLTSSVTLIVSEKGLTKRNKWQFLIGLTITLVFSLVFLGLEISEFYQYVQEGYGISTNTFLSAFYVLVGLHAAHVLFGACWMIVLFTLYGRNTPNALYTEKLKIFSYYWHFVDIIWIFIIILVYLPYLM